MIKCSAISRSISSLDGIATTLTVISSKLASNHLGAILELTSTKPLNLADVFDLSLTVITSPGLTTIEAISALRPV